MKAKAFINFIEKLAMQVDVTKGNNSQNEQFIIDFNCKLWDAIVKNTKAIEHDPTNWMREYISIWIEKFANGDYILDFWTSCSGADNNDRRFIVVYNN